MERNDLDEMNEAELARFYEDHMGDMTLWEEKPLDLPKATAVGTRYTMAIDAKDLTFIARYAFANGLSLDDFIRTAALEAAKAGKRKSNTATTGKD